MLSKELLQQIKWLELKAGHLVTSSLTGEYTSAFRGQGMEFDEVREYVPGDDVRNIDWNVTARMNQPFVKVFREERELNILLLVDISISQSFGTEKRLKIDIAAEMAAILAFLAIRNNDKVGLIAFSNEVEYMLPLKKGRGHVWRVIRDIMTLKTLRKCTDMQVVVDFTKQIMKQRCLCFVISDFLDVDHLSSLSLLKKQHQVTCIQTLDPREKNLQPIGCVEFMDMETNKTLWIDTNSPRIRKSYQERWEEHEKTLKKQMQEFGLGFLQIETNASVVEPLVSFFRKRERRCRCG